MGGSTVVCVAGIFQTETLQRLHSYYIWGSNLLLPRSNEPLGPKELRKRAKFSAKELKAAAVQSLRFLKGNVD